MAKQKLDILLEDDFLLWGLISSSGGHRICWDITHYFDFKLSRQEDIIIERMPESDNLYFNYYLFVDEVNFFRIELIKNKNNGENYLKELKNFDFILMVKGELDFFEVESFTNTLKKLKSIQSALSININNIKSSSLLNLE